MAAAVFVAGCSDSATLIGPENQLEVTNAVDQFQFQVTGLFEVTDSRSYQWENTGTQATVDVSQAITGGSAILTIRDAAGTIMYQEEIAQDSDGNTAVGVAGTWQIDIVLTESRGTFNFRVQKTT
jgi:hypothetical protein